MRVLAAVALLLLPASPALAQTAPPAGSTAGAEGTTTAGEPMPGGRQGEGKQSATEGSKMVKEGGEAPAAAGTPAKP